MAPCRASPVVRLMIARRVQVMWSSQRLAHVVAQAELLGLPTIAGASRACGCVAVRVGSHAVRDGEGGERAEKGDQRREAIGIGREARVVFMSVFLSVV